MQRKLLICKLIRLRLDSYYMAFYFVRNQFMSKLGGICQTEQNELWGGPRLEATTIIKLIKVDVIRYAPVRGKLSCVQTR